MVKLIHKKMNHKTGKSGNTHFSSTSGRFLVILCLAFFVLQSCGNLEEHALNEYDGALNWQQITKKAEWNKRWDHEVAVLNDELYLVGGYNQGQFNGDPYFEDVWKSTNGENWTQIVDNAPWLGRRGHSLITFNDGTGDALYLIGGFSVNEETGVRAYNNDVWKSADGASWTEIKMNNEVGVKDTTDWVARMNHKCVVANHGGQDYIYLVGGSTMLTGIEGRYAIKYTNDVWRSTNGIDWENVGITDYGIRAEHAMVVDANGTIYLQGGQHGLIFESADSSLDPVRNYDYLWQSTDGKTWTSSSDPVIQEAGFLARTGHDMIFYRDKIWTLSGKTNSLEHFLFTNPNHYPTWTIAANGSWEVDSYGTAIDARHNYASVVWQDRIWVFGGNTNKNGQDNDIWAGSLN